MLKIAGSNSVIYGSRPSGGASWIGPPERGVVVIALTIRSTSPTSAKTRSTSFGFEASAVTPTAPGTSSTNSLIVSSVLATPATRQPSAAKSPARTRPSCRAPKTRSVGTGEA
jgi:hypothetical protein